MEGFFGWKKRGEKREYVDAASGEAAAKPVVENGNVIGMAKGPEEEAKMHLGHSEEFREAA